MITQMRKLFLLLLLVLVGLAISNLQAANYYWVGGAGDWSDISHWATTSGGGVTHNQAPTADDDVFFDANSFTAAGQIVNLNTDIIFCRNFNVSGTTNTPTISGGTTVTFNVYGNWVLTPEVVWDFTGAMIFAGSNTGLSIDFGPHDLGQDVLFSGTGSWELNSALNVDSAFVFSEGDLNLNGQPINCQYFHSLGAGNRTLNLSSSTITIGGVTLDPFNGSLPDAIIPPLRISGENLNMLSGTSVVELTADAIDIWLEGPGTVNFNRVFLSNPVGSSWIIPWLATNGSQPAPVMNYAELELRHETVLLGSPSIGNLILQPDQRYTFEGGENYLLGDIQANGSCLAAISLASTDDANPANFETVNNVTVDFVSLRGIAATGTGSFTANNAIDLGNNPGWTIMPRAPQSLYWIGGTGNWMDPAHWSLTSGGPSSGCIPSAIDDVFFDANSFNAGGQMVTIDVDNAYCHNMDWTGATNNPTFAGPMNFNVRLTGSLTMIAAMEHTFAGAYFFESDQAGNTLTTAGQPFNFDLNFVGTNGEWILQDDIFVNWNIYFTSGTLRTNDQAVVCNRFYSELDAPRTLTLGNSYFRMEARDFQVPVWDVNSTNLNFDAGTSIIESTGGTDNLFRNGGSGNMVFNVIIGSSIRLRLFSLIDFPGPTLAIDSLILLGDGFISGENVINYLELSAGRTYEIVSGVVQTITELAGNGDCAAGLIYLRSANIGTTTAIDISTDLSVDRFFIRGIEQQGTGILTANNSADGGDNQNWNFVNSSGTTLYWVGDSGDWFEQANWSFSSGGPGGACIPTPLDDVVFDENSFVTPNAFLTNLTSFQRYCRDFTVTAGVTENPSMGSGFLDIFGSLALDAPVRWFIAATDCNGQGVQTIRTTGNELGGLDISTSGTYELVDPLRAQSLNIQRGTFVSNDFNIEIQTFFGGFIGNNRVLDLGSSYVTIWGNNPNIFTGVFNVYEDGLDVLPGTYTIEISGNDAGMIIRGEVDLNNVVFSNPEVTTAYVESLNSTINYLRFFGDGELRGTLTMDSLFCAPGKSYELEANAIQIINQDWRIIGNNCTPIELSSSLLGTTATVQMPASAVVLADFIQMRDISATGGANFLAGVHSTDIDNSNQGWVFESQPDITDIGFLGPDRALCVGEPLSLDAYNFSLGETYLWQDGSMDSNLVVDQSGVYSVVVTFQNNCVIRDTIEVLAAEDFSIDLGQDTALCSGETLLLETGVDLAGVAFNWQDASTDPTFVVTMPGSYSVTAEQAGCFATDTIEITYNDAPNLDLGGDLTPCEGDDFSLMSNVTADTYLWQDGSILPNFTGDQNGIYWLEASNADCSTRDSVVVSYVDAAALDLGGDTTLCDASDFVLNVDLPGATFEWQDGSTNESFTATQSGTFFVAVNLEGCVASDTIELIFQNNPDLEIEDEAYACTGETVQIEAMGAADNYSWSNGDMGPFFATTLAGDYTVAATFGSCLVEASFAVFINDRPQVTSLGSDTTICSNATLVLMGDTDLGDPSWQDGSNGTSFAVNEAGTYIFTADNFGCTSADTIVVAVTEIPAPDLEPDYATCEGTTFTLTTIQNADAYLWSNGDTSPVFITNTPGTYSLLTTYANCSLTQDFNLAHFAPPFLDLGQDTIACDNQPFVINPTRGIGELTWPDGSNSDTFSTSLPGSIIATLDNEGCVNTDTISIAFRECRFFQAYLPNAFSPNFDGRNDEFGLYYDRNIEIIEFNMQVFSRWGDQLFVSEEINNFWDGSSRGKTQDMGIYVYQISITYRDDLGINSANFSGDVLLTR